MKKLTAVVLTVVVLFIAVLIAGGLLGARVTLAADYSAAMRRGKLGSPSRATYAQKTVKINASTQTVDVEHFGALIIENDRGQSFVWTFDTINAVSFPLKVIAPKDFAAGETRVYIHHPAAHIFPGR